MAMGLFYNAVGREIGVETNNFSGPLSKKRHDSRLARMGFQEGRNFLYSRGDYGRFN